jgi:hypothetical protein
MARTRIHDLDAVTPLDDKAMAALRGGRTDLWWQPISDLARRTGAPTINQYFVNQYIADQIQINNQYQTLNVIDSNHVDADLSGNASNGLETSNPAAAIATI